MIRRPPRSTHCISSATSDVYKRQRHRSEVQPRVVGREAQGERRARSRYRRPSTCRRVEGGPRVGARGGGRRGGPSRGCGQATPRRGLSLDPPLFPSSLAACICASSVLTSALGAEASNRTPPTSTKYNECSYATERSTSSPTCRWLIQRVRDAVPCTDFLMRPIRPCARSSG